jgi:hypothetical protein
MLSFFKVKAAVRRFVPDQLVAAMRSQKIDQDSLLVGMTSLSEQLFYAEVGAASVGKAGAIVDLGCWLCSTTISLARGVRMGCAEKSQARPGKIYAYDKFVWEPWMDQFLPMVSCDYREGDSFLPEARRRMKEYADLVELIQADLTRYRWEGGAINVLLVDAMKNKELVQEIAMSFYPHLVTGAVLIHQDYKHFYTPWIHVLQYQLRAYFELMCDVRDGCTTAFVLKERIPQEVLENAAKCDGLSDADIDSVFRYSMSVCEQQEGRSAVAAAHVMYYVHQGEHRKALDTVALYKTQELGTSGDFVLAEQALAEMLGK